MKTQLEGAKQKLKEIQNSHNQIIRSNKRISSALANSGSKPKRRRQSISKLSRQQKLTRKKLHNDVVQALSFLDDNGVHPSSITLVHDTAETEVLNLDSGMYTKPQVIQ